MEIDNVVELELVNGKHILITRNWYKVHSVYEKTRNVLSFTKKFPFISFKKVRYTSFKYRTHYESIDDFFDPKYKVNCTLSQLATLFGAKIVQFEKTCIDSDIYS